MFFSVNPKSSASIRYWRTPSGQYYNLYRDMLTQTHLLVAGKTGSGKSVVLNGIVSTALYTTPNESQFIFVDLKRVELCDYREIPHCIMYADEIPTTIQAFEKAISIIEDRYIDMQAKGLKKYTGGHLYVVIDELADLMCTCKKQALPLLQRIAQLGRAANVHLIVATQCPLVTIIPTEVKVNFDSVLGLKTVTAQHSRNIINVKGCEALPKYGYGYYQTPDGMTLEKIPMIPEDEIARLVQHWLSADCMTA